MKREDIAKILKGSNRLKKMKLYARKTTGDNLKIWIYHDHKQKSLGLPSLKESSQNIKADEMMLLKKAMQLRDELEANADGIASASRKIKASKLMEEWAETFSVPNSKNNSKIAAKHFLKACGDMPAGSIGRIHLVKMMDAMKRNGHNQNYVRDTASKIRAFCNWAEQRGHMKRVDTRRLLPPQTFGEVKILTEAEITRLASVPCECPDVKDMFLLGVYTAQRIGEIKQYTFALWRDRQIRVRQGKTGKFIAIPLSEGALGIIERLRDRRISEGLGVGDNDKIFNVPNDKFLRSIFKKWLSSAGLDGKVDLRNCRSTAISLLINKGVPEAVTQELANHADVRTTARYYRQIDDSRKKDALAKIPVF